MKKCKFIIIIGALILSACNGRKGTSTPPSPTQRAEVPAATEVVEDTDTDTDTDTEIDIETDPISIDIDATVAGEYLAVFEALNPQITSKITGAFTFSRKVEKDQVVGDVRITNAGEGLLHSQYVRTGTRCPSLQDDTNADGIIDAVEGEAVYGQVFFPLDGDLSSQSSQDRFFPVGDIYGNYYYTKVARFSDFVKDLRSIDSSDGYFKLKPREPMNIEGRVVVIHGVDQGLNLPSTVRTSNSLANHQTLPIVCGVISKVLDSPGEIDDGTYPKYQTSSSQGPTVSR